MKTKNIEIVNRRYIHPRNLIAAVTQTVNQQADFDFNAPVFDPGGNSETGDTSIEPNIVQVIVGGFPMELLANVEVQFNLDTSNWEIALGLDGLPDPPNSTNFAYFFYELDVNAPTNSLSGYHNYVIASWQQDELGLGGGRFPTDIEIENVLDGDYVSFNLWIRARAEEHAVYSKVWLDGDTEPVDWTDSSVDPVNSLVEVFSFAGIQMSGDYDGSNTSTISWKSFEVVEGISEGTDTFTRTVTDSWGSGELGSWNQEAYFDPPSWSPPDVNGSAGVLENSFDGWYMWLSGVVGNSPDVDGIVDSGTLVEETLSRSGGAFLPTFDVDFYQRVWFDGLLALPIEHWTLSGSAIIANTPLTAGTEVIGRYFVG